METFLILILFLIFVFGTLVGSFLNVVSDRWSRNESIVKKRSYCEFCKHQLTVLDLIPIVSFFSLGGNCRYCQKKLSWQYPLVEIVSGLLFLFAYYLTFGFTSGGFSILWIKFLFLSSLFSSILVIFISDLKYGIILDEIVIFGSSVTFLYIAFVNFYPVILGYLSEKSQGDQIYSLFLQERIKFAFSDIGASLLSGILVAFFFLALLLLTRGRGMGAGDVKFGFLIGLACGIRLSLVALFFSFLSGALVSLLLILFGKRKFGQTIPFGPFLAFGLLLTLAWGRQIFDWYTRFSGF